MGYQYYRVPEGYLCGGGGHFVSHQDVDNMMKYGTQPYIETVNFILKPGNRAIAPPAEGWHEPMHWSPAQRLNDDVEPMPLKYDGTPWDMSSVQDMIDEDRREYQHNAQVLGCDPMEYMERMGWF